MKRLQGNFTIVLNDFVTDKSLDCYEFRILCYLLKLADENMQCYPSLNNIANVLSISRSKVKESINKLEDLNYISFQKRYKDNGFSTSNLYTVVDK